MDRIILDYHMVHARGINDFNEKMAKTVQDGWQPFGSPVVVEINGEIHYYQAVAEVEDGPLISGSVGQ